MSFLDAESRKTQVHHSCLKEVALSWTATGLELRERGTFPPGPWAVRWTWYLTESQMWCIRPSQNCVVVLHLDSSGVNEVPPEWVQHLWDFVVNPWVAWGCAACCRGFGLFLWSNICFNCIYDNIKSWSSGSRCRRPLAEVNRERNSLENIHRERFLHVAAQLRSHQSSISAVHCCRDRDRYSPRWSDWQLSILDHSIPGYGASDRDHARRCLHVPALALAQEFQRICRQPKHTGQSCDTSSYPRWLHRYVILEIKTR